MRSTIFNLAFYAYTFLSAFVALPLTVLPSRKPLAGFIRLWAKGTVLLMRWIAGIAVEIRGRENLPADGPRVIAGKHQSECDGIIVMSLIPDIAFVAMKELEKLPFVSPILRKLEMVMVETCGGGRERETLVEGGRKASAAGRSILIYPEGHLMAVGKRERYRTGVHHLAFDLGLPVIPVATNIGLRWDRRMWRKKPGPAVVEFLPSLAPIADKAAFMARLEEVIEAGTERLVLEQA